MLFARFAVTRALLAMFTLILVSLIVFSLMELVPGDCAERYLSFKSSQGGVITAADIDAERARLGLDRPYLVRWGSWIVKLPTLTQNVPVWAWIGLTWYVGEAGLLTLFRVSSAIVAFCASTSANYSARNSG